MEVNFKKQTNRNILEWEVKSRMVDQRATVHKRRGIHSVFSTLLDVKQDAQGLKAHFCPAKTDILFEDNKAVMNVNKQVVKD